MSYVLTVLITLAYVGIGAVFAANIAIDTFSAGLIFIFWPILSPFLAIIWVGKIRGERGERRFAENREREEAAAERARRAQAGREYREGREGAGA